MRRPFAVLLGAAIATSVACSDSQAPAAPVLPPEPEPAIPSASLQLDAGLLKSIGEHKIAVGERFPVMAPTGSLQAVRESDVVLRDTSVISIDAAGMLHAMSLGHSWVVWSKAAKFDSAYVSVEGPDSLTTLQQPYIAPLPPRNFVDVRYPGSRTRGLGSGKLWRVEVGGDLQFALNSAQPGDEVVLASGATFTGNYVLPKKTDSSTDWIVVRAEAIGVAAGSRMTPELAATAALIQTPNGDPAIRTALGARRWRLVGLQVAHREGTGYNYGIVVLGRGDEKVLSQQPSDIVLDRMYIHGSTTGDTRRCVAFNGRSMALIDSWLGECHTKGADAQGVCGWNGGGPFLIENNHIAASGQAVMFGGADPVIRDLSPSDIIIRRNYLYKPLSWARGKWTVKATFELKHGRRVLFENNLLENHWADAQSGFAILLQTLADNNLSWEWTTVQDVEIRNNVIKNSTSGANLVGRVVYHGGKLPINPTSRVALVNNLWLDVGVDPISGAGGRLFQILNDVQDLTLANNAVSTAGRASYAIIFDGTPGVRTTITNNVFTASNYGIGGSGRSPGRNTLDTYAPNGVLTGNVIPGQPSGAYPPGNFFPPAGPSIALLGNSMSAACSQGMAWLALLGYPVTVGVTCNSLYRVLAETPFGP